MKTLAILLSRSPLAWQLAGDLGVFSWDQARVN